MNWLKKVFGYRTQRAPSGSLPVSALHSIAEGLAVNAGISHGVDWCAGTVSNTDSMLPVFDANALLILEPCDFNALQEGDIVTYRSKRGLLIVHRLNEKLRDGWWPLGDGNGRLDPELVTPTNLHRRVCGILYGRKTPETDQ